jgi:hypothetical protein
VLKSSRYPLDAYEIPKKLASRPKIHKPPTIFLLIDPPDFFGLSSRKGKKFIS